jgi:hypothetical protein
VVKVVAGGTAIDSNFVIVVWRGTNVDQLIYVVVDAAGNVNNLGYYPDTTNVSVGNATAAVTAGTPSGTCHSIDLTYAADLVKGATCTPVSIPSSFNIQFQVAPAATLTTYAMSTTSLPGVRLLIPASPSATDRFRPSRVLTRLHTVALPITGSPAR